MGVLKSYQELSIFNTAGIGTGYILYFYCKFVFNMENISLIVSEILMIVFLTLLL